MTYTYHMKTMTDVDAKTIQQMKDWLSECQWADVEPEEFDAMADDLVIRGVERHYVGGVTQFLKDGGVNA